MAGNPVVTGTTIDATVHNATMADLGAALTQSLSKDGQTAASANIPMGGFKLTSVGDATARNQYPSAGQIQDGDLQEIGTVSGTNIITGSLTPAITNYATGAPFVFLPANDNTAAVTIALNGLAAKAIVKQAGTSLTAGDLKAGVPAWITYNGTSFYLANPQHFDDLTVTDDLTVADLIATTITVNGIAHTDFARLSIANIFAGDQTISSGTPALVFSETDGGADDKHWRIRVASEQLQFALLNDSLAGAVSWLTVDRTDTTVDSIAFAATTVTVNGVSIRNASILNAGTVADAQISLSSVQQHQGSFAIAADQIVTSINTSNGNFTVAATHQEDVVTVTAAGTVTLADSSAAAFATGDSVAVMRDTSGAVAFAVSGSQSIKSPGSRLSIPEQNGIAVATYLGANVWALAGV